MNNSTVATEIFTENYVLESVCDWIDKAKQRETKQLFTWYLATAVVNIVLSINCKVLCYIFFPYFYFSWCLVLVWFSKCR